MYATIMHRATFTAITISIRSCLYDTRMWSRSCGFGQQFSDTKMREDDIRSPIQRFIVGPFEAFAFDRRMEQSVDLVKKMLHIVIGDFATVILQQVINPYQQIGNRVEPGKPGVLLKQLKQLVHRLNRTTNALIGQLLGNDEGAMKADEAFPDAKDRAPARIDRNQRCGLG